MSTLVGIKRPPESGVTSISKAELLAVVGRDASLSFEKDGVPGLNWSGATKSAGMWFNLKDGEIWSAGSVDDATLRKMQDLAHELNAKLVTEEGEFFDLDESPPVIAREPLARGQILFRVYALVLVISVIVFYFLRR